MYHSSNPSALTAPSNRHTLSNVCPPKFEINASALYALSIETELYWFNNDSSPPLDNK